MQRALNIIYKKENPYSVHLLNIYKNIFVVRKVFKILSLGGNYFHSIMMLINLPWWSANPWGIAYLYQEGFIVDLLSFAHWEWDHLELSLRDTTAPSQNLSLFWLYLFNLLTAVWATPSLTTASSTVNFWHTAHIKSSARMLQSSLWLYLSPSLSPSSPSLCGRV